MDSAALKKLFEDHPGKTQRGLAVTLSLDPAAVNRMLIGKREIKAREVPKIHAYFNAVASIVGEMAQFRNGDLLPVLGMAEGGKDGLFEWNGEIVDRVPRPPHLVGALDAYAIYVAGESMVPRFRPGELLYVHAKRQPAVGDFGVFQIQASEHEPVRAFVKELAKRTPTTLTLRQYNPAKDIPVPVSTIIAQHRIVGSSS